jgi:hypothetical protein
MAFAKKLLSITRASNDAANRPYNLQAMTREPTVSVSSPLLFAKSKTYNAQGTS